MKVIPIPAEMQMTAQPKAGDMLDDKLEVPKNEADADEPVVDEEESSAQNMTAPIHDPIDLATQETGGASMTMDGSEVSEDENADSNAPKEFDQEMMDAVRRASIELALMDPTLNPNPLTPRKSSARDAYVDDDDDEENQAPHPMWKTKSPPSIPKFVSPTGKPIDVTIIANLLSPEWTNIYNWTQDEKEALTDIIYYKLPPLEISVMDN